MTEQKLVELKPCPFCGCDAALAVAQDFGIAVRCTNYNCKNQTHYMYDNLGLLGEWPDTTALETVVKRWNKRQEDSDKELTEMQKYDAYPLG